MTISKCYTLFLVFIAMSLSAQHAYHFDPSFEHPFGLPNPEAPEQILDFAPFIGESKCVSVSRGSGQEWNDPVEMIWRWKYIMNGHGVQDETLKEDGVHSGSIRQFIADSSKWYVHYYSSGGPSTVLPVWEGNKNEEGNIILYREQKAPNGMDGFYKLSFYDITDESFKWLGEWVTPDETISFPTWKIDCDKIRTNSNDDDRKAILALIDDFSNAYMNADYKSLANAYTTDGKIFPGNAGIIEGRKAIEDRWTIRNGSKILHHKITPLEIKFLKDHAYDYGIYEGKTKSAEGDISSWKGKYVIVWKKEDDAWKIYLDIWNRMPNDEK